MFANKQGGINPEPDADVLPPAGYDVISVLLTESRMSMYRVMDTPSGQIHHAYRISSPGPKPPTQPESDAIWYDALSLQKELEASDRMEHIISVQWHGGFIWALSGPERGTSVASFARNDGKRTVDWCAALFEPLAGVVDFAASRNIAHGGIVPELVYFEPETGHVELAGLFARRLAAPDISAYTAPECVHGEAASPSADLYACGCILYKCLTGRPPYTGANTEELTRAILGPVGPPPLLTQDWMKAIIGVLMARSPRDRYRVAVDAASDMRNRKAPAIILPEGQGGQAILLPDVPETGEDLPEHVLPGEPGMADPYARASLDLLRPLRLLLVLPGRLLNGLYDVVTMPFNRQPKVTTADGRTYRPPRKRSALELRIQMLFGKAWNAAIWCVLVFGVVSAAHGAYLTYRDRSAVVGDIKGLPMLVLEGKRSQLVRGDVLESGPQPEIDTGKGGSVTLYAGDARIHLEENTSVVIKRIDYDEGRIRVFEVKKGQVSAYCPFQRMPSARFEIVCNGVRTHVPRSARMRVTCSDNGGANVQVAMGRVPVITGAARVTLPEGKQAWATEDDGIDHVAAVPDKSLSALIDQTGGLPEQRPWDPVMERYTELQEEKIVPGINRMLTFFHAKPASKSTLMNARAVSMAKMSLTALHAALMAEGEPPSELDLKSLKQTELDKDTVRSLLTPFDGKKLLAYYRMKGDAYIAFARGLDGVHSLLRLDTGKITVLKEQDEEEALAMARKKYRDLHGD